MYSLGSGNSAQLQRDIATNKSEIARNHKDINKNSEGVAMAMAMQGLSSLAADENFALSADLGHFEGETAFAASAGMRVGKKTTLSGSLGYGLKRKTIGARVGLRIGWK